MTLGGAAQEKSYSNGHHHHVVPEQSLTCSLCRSHLRDARVLPACLHSFCLGCLQDYAQDRDRFSCPLCKTVRTCEHEIPSLFLHPSTKCTFTLCVPHFYTVMGICKNYKMQKNM